MGNNAKDLLLAAKARDLLIYTRKKTKPVNSDVDARDVAKLLRRIAELDDLGRVREVCTATAGALKKRSKDGFSKVAFRDFGQDMRDIAYTGNLPTNQRKRNFLYAKIVADYR